MTIYELLIYLFFVLIGSWTLLKIAGFIEWIAQLFIRLAIVAIIMAIGYFGINFFI